MKHLEDCRGICLGGWRGRGGGPVNRLPIANDDSVTTPVDTAVVIDVLANDTDPEGGTLIVTAANAAIGTAAVQPDNSVLYTPAAGFAGTDTIGYTIADPQGATAQGNVTVTVEAAPAVNTVPPILSGSTGLGDTLSVTTGTWTGAVGGAFSYQWQRGGTSIPGATGTSYTIQLADDAAPVRCVVTYTNTGGAVPANSNAVTVEDFAPPVNTAAPVASGSTGLGDVLSVTDGTWTANPAVSGYTYQWKRNGVPIAGATDSTYTIGLADDAAAVTCDVTATNAAGSTTQGSNAITVEDFAAPVISGVPAISGTEVEGQTLTASPASVTGNPTPARAWQWKHGGTPISGATAATYLLVSADVGQTIAVEQTETNASGTDTAESAATGTISPAAAGAAPVVTGFSITEEAGGVGRFSIAYTSPASGTAVEVRLHFNNAGEAAPATADEVANGIGAEGTATISTTVGATNVGFSLPGGLDGTYDVYATVRDTSGGTPSAWSGVVNDLGIAFDTTAPVFQPGTSTPADGAAGVAVDANLTANFDETVTLGTGNIYLYQGVTLVETFSASTGGGTGGGTVVSSATQVTLNPGASLAASTGYNVEWDAGAIVDVNGNPVIQNASDTLWNFTTAAGGGGTSFTETFTGANGTIVDGVNYFTFLQQTNSGLTMERLNNDLRIGCTIANSGRLVRSNVSDSGDVYIELDYGSLSQAGGVNQTGPALAESGSSNWVAAIWRQDQNRWRLLQNNTEIAQLSGNAPVAGDVIRLERITSENAGYVRYRVFKNGAEIAALGVTNSAAARPAGAVFYGFYGYLGNTGNAMTWHAARGSTFTFP